MTSPYCVGGMIVLLAAAQGCSPSRTPATAGGGTGSMPTAEAPLVAAVASVHEGEPITADEALAFGRAMEAAVAGGDSASFVAMFDWNAFGQIAFEFFPQETRREQSIRRGLLSGFQQATDKLAPQLFQEISTGSYTLLHVRDTDSPQLVFRMLGADGGLNYHEVCLARRGGQPKVVDIYIHLAGERMSETVQRLMLSAIPPEDLSMLGRLRDSDRELLAHGKKMSDMTAAIQAGDFAQVMRLYRELPLRLQQSKAVLLVRLRAAQQLSEEEHLAAIDAYRAAFPDDPSLHLASLDALTLRKQFTEAHAALTSLDAAVGGDPYLFSIRGNLYVLEGKLAEAESMAELMMAHDSNWQDPYWLQVSIALAKNDHSRTARLLTKLRDELGVELLDLAQVPEYTEFVKSAEFQAWQQISPQAAAPPIVP